MPDACHGPARWPAAARLETDVLPRARPAVVLLPALDLALDVQPPPLAGLKRALERLTISAIQPLDVIRARASRVRPFVAQLLRVVGDLASRSRQVTLKKKPLR